MCILDILFNPYVPSWKVASLRYLPLLPFPQKSSGGYASRFLYFSFCPAEQRDFPGNVSLGGCDSLPLVLVLTSKQHDSWLGYALHFLYITSLQMCCAGVQSRVHHHSIVWRKALFSPTPWANRGDILYRGELHQALSPLSEEHGVSVFHQTQTPKLIEKRRKTSSQDKPTLHLSLGPEHSALWCALYFSKMSRPRAVPVITQAHRLEFELRSEWQKLNGVTFHTLSLD